MTAIEDGSSGTESTSRTIHFHYDWDGDESLSVAIASTVAELSDAESTELETLYGRVDPDALEAIFEPRTEPAGRNAGHVRFRFSGCEITVYGDGFTVVRRFE